MSTPVIDLNSSPDKWIELPLPEEAKLSSPGFSLTSAISSATEWTSTSGLTTSTLGTVATSVTGAKSLIGSKGRRG